MEKIYINYNQISNSWGIGYFLKGLGFRKTADCYWSEDYEKYNTNVILCYEEKQLPTPKKLWQKAILDSLGMYANESPHDDDIKYNYRFAIMSDGEVLAVLSESSTITDAVAKLFSWRKSGKNAKLGTISYKTPSKITKKSDRVKLYSVDYRAFHNTVICRRFFTEIKEACRFASETCGTTPKKHLYKYTTALGILLEQEEIDMYAWKGYIPEYE